MSEKAFTVKIGAVNIIHQTTYLENEFCRVGSAHPTGYGFLTLTPSMQPSIAAFIGRSKNLFEGAQRVSFFCANHRYVRQGIYSEDWGGEYNSPNDIFGE